ncbi:MAG TPA: hypothetical protein VMV48_15405 [Gallionellaceae bacterium]|nr:hypothetical protein [Gallionellaceae bacterium]
MASRLSDEGIKGEILTDRTTYHRLRDQYMFEPPIVTRLKGKGEVPVYRLRGKVQKV